MEGGEINGRKKDGKSRMEEAKEEYPEIEREEQMEDENI